MLKRRKRFIIFATVLFTIILLFVYFRFKDNKDASKQQVVTTVQITSISRTNLTNKLSFTGDILAIQQANLYSRVSGNIKNIYVDIGDYVSNGKLLAKIDDSQFLQTLRQTEGLYNQAKATLENNKINFERNQILYDKGLISKSELDNAETIMKVSEGQVAAALANYRNAQIQLGYCNIRRLSVAI